MSVAIQGFEKLNAKLKQLSSEAVTIDAAKKGVRKGLGLIATNARRLVPKRYEDARKTIATGFRKAKSGATRGEYGAKVGFGVGRDTKARLAKQKAKRAGKPGVGIGKQNIHWFVLGTKHMDPILDGVMKRSVSGSEAAIKSELKAMVDRVRRG